MSQSPSTSSTTTKPIRSGEMILLMTLLDTTWRTFVPTLGGLFLGLGIDILLHKKILWMIILLIVGIIASTLLVIQQMRNVRQTK